VAYYLVSGRAKEGLEELKGRLESGEVGAMRPFGRALEHGLRNARVTEDGAVVWEEEDYCTPPLAMEREAVLDTYFTDLTVERVDRGAGWSQVEGLPRLWRRTDEA